MTKRYHPAIELKEADRQEIAKQVSDFLTQGGKIQQIHTPLTKARPVRKSWQESYSINLEF